MQLQDSYINQLHQQGIIKDKTEEATIRYALVLIRYESLKLFLLTGLFYMLGYLGDFLYTFLILVPIRMTTGGMHFDTNTKCFAFSLCFFVSTVIVLPKAVLPVMCYVAILCIAGILLVFLPLYPNKRRPIVTKKKYDLNKRLSILFFGIIALLLFSDFKNTSFFYCGIWALFLQSLQLLYIYKQKGK